MTRAEMQRQYQVSKQVLQDFETWKATSDDQVSVSQDYTAADLAVIHEITQLRALGFNQLEILTYLQALVATQVALLTTKRRQILATVHTSEQQIATIDYLRLKLQADSEEQK